MNGKGFVGEMFVCVIAAALTVAPLAYISTSGDTTAFAAMQLTAWALDITFVISLIIWLVLLKRKRHQPVANPGDFPVSEYTKWADRFAHAPKGSAEIVEILEGMENHMVYLGELLATWQKCRIAMTDVSDAIPDYDERIDEIRKRIEVRIRSMQLSERERSYAGIVFDRGLPAAVTV